MPPGRLDRALERGFRISPKMFERRVERAKNGWHRRNKQQQCSAGAGNRPRLSQDFVIALDVLQHVHRDEGID